MLIGSDVELLTFVQKFHQIPYISTEMLCNFYEFYKFRIFSIEICKS